MSIIRNIQCNACGFVLLQGTGTALYVKKKPGLLRRLFGLGERKTILPDPPVGKFPGGRGIPDLLDEGRLGNYCAYFCPACTKVFQHDSESEKTCPACGRSDIKSVFEMVGEKCPKCSTGVFEEKKLGIT